ncbi:hypothetical protein HYU08_02470 [Candidatus Woesearchaeota archaeon]|nr:hypothetical protein [Candidatus Woesearchaeota archaeon]
MYRRKMDNTLEWQRKFFDKLQEETSQIKFKEAREEAETKLLRAEGQAEFSYRSAFIRGMIIGKGLEHYMSDIVDGMNKSCLKVISRDFPDTDSIQEYQACIRSDTDLLLLFGQEYIDRWVMYNTLFGNSQ